MRGNLKRQKVCKLATARRHKNIDIIFVNQNLFQQSRWSRTFDLITTDIILFKSLRDVQHFDYLGRQLNLGKKILSLFAVVHKRSFWSVFKRSESQNIRRFKFLFQYYRPETLNFLPTSSTIR